MIIAFFVLYFLHKIYIKDKTEAYIGAAAWWMLICFALTEGLSFGSMIEVNNVRLAWALIDLCGLCIIGVVKKCKKIKCTNLLIDYKKIFSVNRCVFVFFCVCMLFFAIKTVPYNWDSMTYHCARLFHWLQNGSIEHYATNISRQVSSPVLGAIVNLNVYAVCAGNDIFLNLLQSISYLSVGAIVYAIAGKIGCSKSYCRLAAVLFYSTPIAFAEALTTQVDNFAAFWLAGFVYILLDFLNSERIQFDFRTFCKIFIITLCISFGYLAKPSVGFAMLFFCIWLLITVVLRKDKLSVLLKYFFISAILILAILLPEWLRNINTFHALAAKETGARQLISSFHLKHIIINCIKNITFNLPNIYVYNSSNLIYKFVVRLGRLWEIDINNPAISEDGKEFYVWAPQNYGHDTAVNPIIVFLLIICLILLIVRFWKLKSLEMRDRFFICSAVAFITFCAALKWEPFVSRYMISYFALLCVGVAAQLEGFFCVENEKGNSGAKVVKAIVYMAIIVELYGLVSYHTEIIKRNVRNSGYFENRREVQENYESLADAINKDNYKNIGLYLGVDTYEYPLTALIDNFSRIEHINVENETAVYEDASFIPEAIIVINMHIEGSEFLCHGNQYEIAEVIDDGYYLLKRE